MTGLQKADAGVRRQALVFVVVGALAGILLMVAVERYRLPLQDWLLSDPAQLARRLVLLARLAAALLSAPLLGFAIYLWSFGVRVMRMRRYPPPGCRVIRDTPILQGQAAQGAWTSTEDPGGGPGHRRVGILGDLLAACNSTG